VIECSQSTFMIWQNRKESCPWPHDGPDCWTFFQCGWYGICASVAATICMACIGHVLLIMYSWSCCWWLLNLLSVSIGVLKKSCFLSVLAKLDMKVWRQSVLCWLTSVNWIIACLFNSILCQELISFTDSYQNMYVVCSVWAWYHNACQRLLQ
jgi:hypothetical protein